MLIVNGLNDKLDDVKNIFENCLITNPVNFPPVDIFNEISQKLPFLSFFHQNVNEEVQIKLRLNNWITKITKYKNNFVTKNYLNDYNIDAHTNITKLKPDVIAEFNERLETQWKLTSLYRLEKQQEENQRLEKLAELYTFLNNSNVDKILKLLPTTIDLFNGSFTQFFTTIYSKTLLQIKAVSDVNSANLVCSHINTKSQILNILKKLDSSIDKTRLSNIDIKKLNCSEQKLFFVKLFPITFLKFSNESKNFRQTMRNDILQQLAETISKCDEEEPDIYNIVDFNKIVDSKVNRQYTNNIIKTLEQLKSAQLESNNIEMEKDFNTWFNENFELNQEAYNKINQNLGVLDKNYDNFKKYFISTNTKFKEYLSKSKYELFAKVLKEPFNVNEFKTAYNNFKIDKSFVMSKDEARAILFKSIPISLVNDSDNDLIKIIKEIRSIFYDTKNDYVWPKYNNPSKSVNDIINDAIMSENEIAIRRREDAPAEIQEQPELISINVWTTTNETTNQDAYTQIIKEIGTIEFVKLYLWKELKKLQPEMTNTISKLALKDDVTIGQGLYEQFSLFINNISKKIEFLQYIVGDNPTKDAKQLTVENLNTFIPLFSVTELRALYHKITFDFTKTEVTTQSTRPTRPVMSIGVGASSLRLKRVASTVTIASTEQQLIEDQNARAEQEEEKLYKEENLDESGGVSESKEQEIRGGGIEELQERIRKAINNCLQNRFKCKYTNNPLKYSVEFILNNLDPEAIEAAKDEAVAAAETVAVAEAEAVAASTAAAAAALPAAAAALPAEAAALPAEAEAEAAAATASTAEAAASPVAAVQAEVVN